MAEPTGLRPHTTQGVLSPPCPPKKFSLETGKGVFSSRWGGRGEAAASPSGCLWPTPSESHPICTWSTVVPRLTQEPRDRVV